MFRRIAGREDCGHCYRKFLPFEIVFYLGIDNNSFCAACRELLRPGEKDDPRDGGGWVPAIYVGRCEDGHNNILQLIELWNKSLGDEDYSHQIHLKERDC